MEKTRSRWNPLDVINSSSEDRLGVYSRGSDSNAKHPIIWIINLLIFEFINTNVNQKWKWILFNDQYWGD